MNFLGILVEISCNFLRNLKPRVLNGLRTARKPNARMCGWDCELALGRLRMVRIPFTANQNSSVFCMNIKRTGCAGCPLLASGWRKINKLCAKYVPHANGTVHKRHARVYKVFRNWRKILRKIRCIFEEISRNLRCNVLKFLEKF